MLTRIMLLIVLFVLAVNIFMHKPPIASVLFALALAVGLTPELLPAIISITLSHGAKTMAKLGVIVRRLNSIENLGSMDVLCTDKTGTLTAGVVELDGAFDILGQASPTVLRLAAINAKFQTGLSNPIDDAVNASAANSGVDLAFQTKVDEIPYDVVRKCLSIVVSDAARVRTLVTKGVVIWAGQTRLEGTFMPSRKIRSPAGKSSTFDSGSLRLLRAPDPRIEMHRTSSMASTRLTFLSLIATTTFAASQNTLAQIEPSPPGRLLASNCFQCHGTNGNGPGFDKLAGKSAAKLFKEMKAYQAGEEGEGIMARHAMGYTDAQLRALSQWLSQQRR